MPKRINEFTEVKSPTAIIFGNPMIVVDIPYEEGFEGIFPLENGVEYYCALQKDVVLSICYSDTVRLRNDLEHILSNSTHKEMELGFATFATNPVGKEVVLCLFKERGVPECRK